MLSEHPTTRAVDRIELPSTSISTTAARFSNGNLFMPHPPRHRKYGTGLAQTGLSGWPEECQMTIRGFTLPTLPNVAQSGSP